jgi:hypothetical protein
VAITIEQRGIDVILDLTWHTAMQHMDIAQEPILVKALGDVGDILAQISVEQRYRLLGQPYQFRARGISSLLDRARDRNALIAAVGMILQNPLLAQAFFRRYSEEKVIDRFLRLYGIDTTGLEREEGEPAPVPPTQEPGQGGATMPAGTPPAVSGAMMGGAPR